MTTFNAAFFIQAKNTMAHNQLWYTRRDKEIRGPFPVGQITRYILLGRIRLEDELSIDQLSWVAASEFPELIPEELKKDLSIPENQEILRIARMREDERESTDRRSKQSASYSNHNRSGEERRKDEATEELRHREIKDQLLASLREKNRENYISRFVWITFVLVVIAYITVLHP